MGWRADHDRRHVHLPAAGQVRTAQAGGVLRLPHHCDGCQLWIRGTCVPYCVFIEFIWHVIYNFHSEKYNCFAGVAVTLTLFCTPAYLNKHDVMFIKLGTGPLYYIKHCFLFFISST